MLMSELSCWILLFTHPPFIVRHTPVSTDWIPLDVADNDFAIVQHRPLALVFADPFVQVQLPLYKSAQTPSKAYLVFVAMSELVDMSPLLWIRLLGNRAFHCWMMDVLSFRISKRSIPEVCTQPKDSMDSFAFANRSRNADRKLKN